MSHPNGAHPAQPVELTPVPEGTSSTTPWIWVIIALPLAQALVNIVIPASSMMSAGPSGIPTFAAGYYLVQGVSLLVYLVVAALAFLDWRELKRRGFVLPFHWAWSFLGGIVYVIGRSVVVHRRSGKGLATLWVYLVVFAVALVIGIIKATQIAEFAFAGLLLS
ncbi:MAG: hypothetical protein RI885_838 [Actinomycetota bacterium]